MSVFCAATEYALNVWRVYNVYTDHITNSFSSVFSAFANSERICKYATRIFSFYRIVQIFCNL